MIKIVVLFTSAMLISLVSHASEPTPSSVAKPATSSSPKTNQGWENTCKLISELAKQIMTNRQDGAAMSDMIDSAESSEDDKINNLTEQLVIEAFDQPRYSTDEMKNNAIEDFRDQAYLQCAKALAPQ